MSKTSSSLEIKGGDDLSVKEVAYILKVSPVAVYKWCQSGKIDSFRVVGAIRIPKKTVNILKGSTS